LAAFTPFATSRREKTVTTVGGVPYTLPVKSVESIKQTEITGPTQSDTAWSAVPRVALNMVTAALVAQSLNYTPQRHSEIQEELLNGETLYLANPRSNKQGRTVRTVNNYISLLCSLLRFAHKSGFISGKPFEGIKKLHKGKVKPDPLTKQEFSLLAESERTSLNMWTFAVYTGVRHGELAALAWEDIDWEKGTAHIQRNLNALGMFVPPKTDAGDRVITLLEPALEALKAQRTLTSLQPKTEIVFHHREYGAMEYQNLRFVFMPRMRKGKQKAYYSLSSIGSRFNAAVKRAGIRRRNPYHTRHTFACWLYLPALTRLS
jgi:integrase